MLGGKGVGKGVDSGCNGDVGEGVDGFRDGGNGSKW